MSVSVRLPIVKKWISEIDPTGIWLRYETQDNSNITKIFCELCRTHKSKLKTRRNFSTSFIDGTNILKKDSIIKHSKSDMHMYAVNEGNKPQNIRQFFSATLLGKSMTSASDATKSRINKLMDITYVLGKEEIAFAKFPKLVELEQKHGVDLGQSYHSSVMCAEFTSCIAEELDNKLRAALKDVHYFTMCTDGSTDVSTSEKEMVYLMCVDEGETKVSFLKLEELKSSNAQGVYQHLLMVLNEYDLSEKKLVGFLSDGASINIGCKKGIAALFKEQSPWLIIVHCLNHRLELSVKEYTKGTYFEKIFRILQDLHTFYEKSPKRMRL